MSGYSREVWHTPLDAKKEQRRGRKESDKVFGNSLSIDKIK